MSASASTPSSAASRPATRTVIAAAGLALLMLIGFTVGVLAADPPASLQSLQHDPHVLDTTGLCGGTVVDRFFINPSGQATGRKAVQLPDGDTVVAALVPQWGAAPTANGMRNLGLVRYRLPCQHTPWSNAGSFGFPTSGFMTNRYLVYPNDSDPRYRNIHDMKVFGGRIYVLVDQHETASIFSQRDVHVVVFNLDGSLVGFFPALNSALDERGAGMAFYQDGSVFPPPPAKLFVTGTTFGLPQVPNGSTATLVRMTVLAGGGLSRDTNLGAGGNQVYMDYFLPDNFCAADARPCHGIVNGLALTQSGGIFNRLYLGGALRRTSTGDWDYLVIAANFNGTTVTGFGGGGMQWAIFNRGGSNRDIANAIAARQVAPFTDEVFLVGEVHQQTGTNENAGNRGIGVAKFNNSGFLDSGFGFQGKVVFGGCATPPCSNIFDQSGDPESFPRAVVATGNRLVIASRERRRPPCVISVIGGPCEVQPHRASAELAIVTADNGVLVDHASHIPDGEMFDVLTEPGGRITTAGVFVEGGLPRALTAQFRSYRLFGDGFE